MAKKSKQKESMREKAKKHAEKNMNRGRSSYLNLPNDTEQFKPKKKTFNMDVIPYVISVKNHPEVKKGEMWYQRTIWVHYGINGNAYICPRTIKKPCPICEYVKELSNSKDSESNDLGDSIKAKERELYNIIDLDNPDKGIQLFEYSYHLFGKVLDEEINEGDDELGGFADLKGGMTLEVPFRKKKLGKNEFFEARKIDFKERDEDYDEDILDEVIDLDKILVIKDYDFLNKALAEIEDEDEDGDDNDEDEEDDDDGDNDNNDDSDDDDNDNDNDDDGDSEDEDDDEDDEDEENNRKKSSKKKKSKKVKSKDKKKKSKKVKNEKDKKDEKKNGEKKKKKKKTPKCPIKEGTFGEDFGEYDECENCKFYDECLAASEDDVPF